MVFPVIDAHVHVQPWKMINPGALRILQGGRADQDRIHAMMYDPSEFMKYLDEERIEKVVTVNYISPDIMGFTPEVLEYAGRFAGECQGRVIPIGSVHPTMTEDSERAMDDLLAKGFRGIKLHPAHQPCYPNDYRRGNRVLETVYRRAEREGLVLMVHTGTSIFPGARNIYTDPLPCDDIGVDFPDLKVVLAHGGRPLWMRQAAFLVRRFPNMYMDVSGIPPQKLLEYFPDLERLAGKVLWGSDWPAPGVPGLRANADRFLNLALSDEAKRKILSENARKVYGD